MAHRARLSPGKTRAISGAGGCNGWASPPDEPRLIGTIRPTAGSPNLGSVRRLPPHRVAFLDAEHVVEGREVPQGTKGAEIARRMRIGGDLLPQRVLANVGAPDLRPRDEEALYRRQTIDELALLADERTLQCLVNQ